MCETTYRLLIYTYQTREKADHLNWSRLLRFHFNWRYCISLYARILVFLFTLTPSSRLQYFFFCFYASYFFFASVFAQFTKVSVTLAIGNCLLQLSYVQIVCDWALLHVHTFSIGTVVSVNRPIGDHGSKDFTVLLIIELQDEYHQQLMLSAALKLQWHDDYLKWNPLENRNNTQVEIFIDDVWLPDLTLNNK